LRGPLHWPHDDQLLMIALGELEQLLAVQTWGADAFLPPRSMSKAPPPPPPGPETGYEAGQTPPMPSPPFPPPPMPPPSSFRDRQTGEYPPFQRR
jgi:hypothetical protein